MGDDTASGSTALIAGLPAAHDANAAPAVVTGVVDGWSSDYRSADDVERRLVEAAMRCIARWGVRKTSLDDIAREARVSRATVYRVYPGGKGRLVEAVFCYEAGRLFHEVDADLAAAGTLDDLLTTGLAAALRLIVDHEVLRTVIEHEPELILPHFAFHQLDRFLDLTAALCHPHLARFLPAEAIRPAADLLARVALSYGFRPVDWLDPHDPDSVSRLVRTYLLPALSPSPDAQELP
jgi:AcrR family transcriptional regulator